MFTDIILDWSCELTSQAIVSSNSVREPILNCLSSTMIKLDSFAALIPSHFNSCFQFAILYILVLRAFLLQVSSGDKNQRMKEALATMGASVFRFFSSLPEKAII